jgi:hypothetical protein
MMISAMHRVRLIVNRQRADKPEIYDWKSASGKR